MNVLIISTCFFEFHELEFVRPIKNICENIGWNVKIVNFENFDKEDIEDIDKIIISGTALKDDEYFDYAENFGFLLKEFKSGILGICAGAQILGGYYNGDLIENCEIGLINNIEKTNNDEILENVDLKEVYSLHNFAISNIKEAKIIAENKNIQIFKAEKNYGILFHPEVRNKKIIENFLQN